MHDKEKKSFKKNLPELLPFSEMLRLHNVDHFQIEHTNTKLNTISDAKILHIKET